MLPSINLPLPDLSNLNPEIGVAPELPADAGHFSASIAEQLVLPLETAPFPELLSDGQSLPQSGNVLPQLPPEVVAGLQDGPSDPVTDLEGAEMLPASTPPESTSLVNAQIQASPVVAAALADSASRATADRSSRPGLGALGSPLSAGQQGLDVTLADKPGQQIGPASAEQPVLPLRSAIPPSNVAAAAPGPTVENADLPTRALTDIAAQLQGSTDMAGARQAAAQTVTSSVQSVDVAALHLQSAQRPVTAAAPQALPTSIDIPVKDAAWGDAVNNQVLMMAGKKAQTAEIRLTPAELGPLRVQMSFDDGSAEITFSAQHAVTREALESALPRLRELFDDNGISLGNASVSDEGVEQRQQDAETATADDGVGGEPADSATATVAGAATAPRTLHNGLIDTFV